MLKYMCTIIESIYNIVIAGKKTERFENYKGNGFGQYLRRIVWHLLPEIQRFLMAFLVPSYTISNAWKLETVKIKI